MCSLSLHASQAAYSRREPMPRATVEANGRTGITRKQLHPVVAQPIVPEACIEDDFQFPSRAASLMPVAQTELQRLGEG